MTAKMVSAVANEISRRGFYVSSGSLLCWSQTMFGQHIEYWFRIRKNPISHTIAYGGGLTIEEACRNALREFRFYLRTSE